MAIAEEVVIRDVETKETETIKVPENVQEKIPSCQSY